MERKRYQFKFWLDVAKPDQLELAEQLEQTTKQRKYAAAVRSALQLWFDLRAGRLDVFKTLFPTVYDAIRKEGESEQLKALQAQIEALKSVQAYLPPSQIADGGASVPDVEITEAAANFPNVNLSLSTAVMCGTTKKQVAQHFTQEQLEYAASEKCPLGTRLSQADYQAIMATRTNKTATIQHEPTTLPSEPATYGKALVVPKLAPPVFDMPDFETLGA